MSQSEAVIAGTIQPDGSLVLDTKPNLPPGRVQVIVHSLPQVPENDPFWQRMQAIWAIPRTGPCDGGEKSLEEVRLARDEWEEHQRELERLQGIKPQ